MGKSPTDSQDLTQGFFAHPLEDRILARAKPEAGRFRSFLLSSLKHLVAHEYERDTALKRGGEPRATVHYLSGTTGWGAKFGGAPTALWNPQTPAQAQAPAVTGGQFEFNLTGPANAMVVVQACTNLYNPVWIPVGTNTLTGGTSFFKDPQWNTYPQRFY